MSDEKVNDVLIPIRQRLQRIDEVNRRLGGPRDFTILGAGISGLVAAYELVQRGHRVEIVEGSNRVGGRIFTARLGPEQPDNPHGRPYVELGAMRIPIDHDYTRHYVDLLGLRLRPFLNNDALGNGAYDLRGVLGKINDFPRIYLDGLDPVFKLTASEQDLVRRNGPSGLLVPALETLLHRLSPEEKDLLVRGLLTTPYLREMDAISLQQLLVEGRPDWGIAPLSADALELLGTGGFLEGLWDRSVSFFVRDELTVNASKLDYIDGGMDRLPRGVFERAVASGRCTVRFNTKVVGLALYREPGGAGVVQVQLEGGESRGLPRVLCTLPFSVLRRIDLWGLSDGKMSAIRNWGYVSSTKVGVYCNRRFWEEDYNIFGGRSVTDHLTVQTYYPNDFEIAREEVAPLAAVAEDLPLTSLAVLPHAPTVRAAESFAGIPEQRPRPDRPDGVLLSSYNWGQNAIRMASLSHPERVHRTLQDIARYQPEVLRYAVPDDSASMAWDQFPWTGGAFSMPRAHDIGLHYSNALQPEGSIFFAGEHLSPVPAWIQGAMASGLYALEAMMRSAIGNP